MQMRMFHGRALVDIGRGPLIALFSLLAFGLIAIGLLSGQSHINTPVSKPKAFSNSFQLVPQVMPASSTNISTLLGGPPAGKDVYACFTRLASKASSGTFTILDAQATPVPLAFQVPLAANSTYQFMSASAIQNCDWFMGGMTVQAGGANTIWFAVSGYWSP